MRAIIAREHKHAVAERAAAATAATLAIAPANAGWSTRAAGKRKASAIAKAHADLVDQRKAEWARRNPAAAVAERGLRKARATAIETFGRKMHGTAETHAHAHAARTNQGALARLWETGAIDADQLADAVEIAGVAERIGADVAVRTASLETRVDSQRHGDGTFFEHIGQVRREVAYTIWRGRVAGPVSAVLEMIVGETVGFTVVAARYGMHNRRAKRLLIEALDLWPVALAQARREVDPATLAAAQAGLL